MFTGASQFALIGVIGSGGAAMSGAMTALLLGSRNTLYGLRVAPLLSWRGWRRWAGAHLLIDESTAMSVNRETVPAARVGFLSTGLSIFALWNLATLVGAVGGTALGDPRTFGLDAAVGAAFLALMWPRLDKPLNRVVALLAVVVALGLVPVTTAGVPVLAAGGVALLVGVVPRRAQGPRS
jgi:predicted branched-subunit amino acid permease